MNPYFTFSAVLACGLYGVKNKLPLTQPALNTNQNAGDIKASLVRLPKTLQEASARMGAEGSLARKVLGDAFVDHYVGTRVRSLLGVEDWTDGERLQENEWELFSQAVTDWELQRYLELA